TDNQIRTPTPETVSAVEGAAAALAGAGAAIDWRLPPFLRDAWDAWFDVIRSDGHAWLQRLITAAGTPGMGSYDTRGWVAVEAPVGGAELTARPAGRDRGPS